MEKRCRSHLKATNDSWLVDETYIKVKKVWMHLYRAVDSQGNTLDRESRYPKFLREARMQRKEWMGKESKRPSGS